MKIKSFAKINLNLHIHPKKLGDQLTPLTLINNQINIYDCLEFINQPNIIELNCYPKNILPENKENIVFQAALKLKEFARNPSLGVKITLHKKIPITAGLGGGSSNAAATLKYLVRLWCLKITQTKLLEIAFNLGQDVPYFFSSNLCLLTGFGHISHKVMFKLPKFYLVIIYPNHSVKPSTGWMFQHLDFSLVSKNFYKVDQLLQAIKVGDKDKILNNLHNDFETIVFRHFPETQKIVKSLISYNASRTLLSGSGLGIIGFFKTRTQAKMTFHNLKSIYSRIYLTQTR